MLSVLSQFLQCWLHSQEDFSCSCAYLIGLMTSGERGHAFSLRAQSCLTLCYPIDGSPPGPSVHGVGQAKILESVAMSRLQVIFLSLLHSSPSRPHSDQGSNSASPPLRAGSLPLSHLGSPTFFRGFVKVPRLILDQFSLLHVLEPTTCDQGERIFE